jgi:hypothetical protein
MDGVGEGLGWGQGGIGGGNLWENEESGSRLSSVRVEAEGRLCVWHCYGILMLGRVGCCIISIGHDSNGDDCHQFIYLFLTLV